MTGHLRVIRKKLIHVFICLGLSLIMTPSAMAHEIAEESSETSIERYINITEVRLNKRYLLRKKNPSDNHTVQQEIYFDFLPSTPCSIPNTRLYLLYHALMYYE